MATERGLDFGTDVAFTHGPLGFLAVPRLWYGDLATLAFLHTAVLWLALGVSVVWALRRTLPAPLAVPLAFLALMVAPSAEVAIALTAVWCLAVLVDEAPEWTVRVVVRGGALLGALESLVLLRSGPVIVVMCAVALAARADRRRTLPRFAACAVVAFGALWFACGQGAGNLDDFVRTSIQVVGGYPQAMGAAASSRAYPAVIALMAVALVATAGAATTASRLRGAAAAAVMAVAAFVLFKEAVVRADPAHLAIFFTTAAILGSAIPFGRRRVVAIGAVVVLAALAIGLPRSDRPTIEASPVAHLQTASRQFRILVSPGRRAALVASGRRWMAAVFRLDPASLRLLRGHTVHIDPWDISAAWFYRLRWDPLPVFQNYSAYTASLDRLNAARLSAPNGPQRILRENTEVVGFQRSPPALDGRNPAWDPPAQSVAMLCDYAPLRTTARWQVLGKVRDRCGAPQLIRSIKARDDQTFELPAAQGGAVLIKIHGAGVGGRERVRTLLYRARVRQAVVNGVAAYRLVPGTAADGLLTSIDARLDFPSPFALDPAARTLAITGIGHDVRIDVLRLPMRGT
jgi:hypothetical protein